MSLSQVVSKTKEILRGLAFLVLAYITFILLLAISKSFFSTSMDFEKFNIITALAATMCFLTIEYSKALQKNGVSKEIIAEFHETIRVFFSSTVLLAASLLLSIANIKVGEMFTISSVPTLADQFAITFTDYFIPGLMVLVFLLGILFLFRGLYRLSIEFFL